VNARFRLRTLMMLVAVVAAMLAAEKWRQHREVRRSAMILRAALHSAGRQPVRSSLRLLPARTE
jgi:type II secretory pathway component PulK